MSKIQRQEVEKLKRQLLNYKVGEKIGLDLFHDAERGEMTKFQVRVAVFGMTGSGKSALINTIHKVLFGKEKELAVVQSAGGEGTEILEEFLHELGFMVIDTRGFFEFDTSTEETELFRILYGAVKTGEIIDRGTLGERKAASVGIAAHKLNKPPLSRQVHVVLWVIKADDVRLTNDQYRDKFKFVQERLSNESITIITAITHGDVIDKMGNLDVCRAEVIEKAREATGSMRLNTFIFANWLSGESEYDVGMQEQVLKMMNTALECAERSVKMRQNQRAAVRLRARQRDVNIPQEDEEDYGDNNMNYTYNKL